jgi:hypothetical protein
VLRRWLESARRSVGPNHLTTLTGRAERFGVVYRFADRVCERAHIEVFGVLAKFRDEEVAAMRSLRPELLGPGRVDPTPALRSVNKGTWFGNILNERVRQRVQTAITETRSRCSCGERARARRASISAAGNRHGLRPALGPGRLPEYEASYVGAGGARRDGDPRASAPFLQSLRSVSRSPAGPDTGRRGTAVARWRGMSRTVRRAR